MKLKFRLKHSTSDLRKLKVKELKQELEEAKSFIIFSSTFISHQQFENLRVKLSQHKAKLRFIKNTLFKVAAQELKLPQVLYEDKILFGPSAMVYIFTEDFISAIKALKEEFGKNEQVKIKIALLDKEIYGREQVMEFSKIPTIEELKAKLVCLLQSPIRNLHYSLSFNFGCLVRGLNQIAQQ